MKMRSLTHTHTHTHPPTHPHPHPHPHPPTHTAQYCLKFDTYTIKARQNTGDMRANISANEARVYMHVSQINKQTSSMHKHNLYLLNSSASNVDFHADFTVCTIQIAQTVKSTWTFTSAANRISQHNAISSSCPRMNTAYAMTELSNNSVSKKIQFLSHIFQISPQNQYHCVQYPLRHQASQIPSLQHQYFWNQLIWRCCLCLR